MEKKVQILLSTYNGEKYIVQQLDSILAQTYTNWQLLIRDDGSSDGTEGIVQEYQKHCPDKIRVCAGANAGACGSFLELAGWADKTCDYYAFCDQDDVWKEDKLERAVQKLSKAQETYGEECPLVYCGALDVVDEHLEWMQKKDLSAFSSRMTFANALVENVCTGCTMVLNAPALRSLCELSGEKRQKILMHDWWVYLYGTCFGHVIYDDYAGIMYRQHSSNVVGETVNPLRKMWNKVSSFRGNRGRLRGQIQLFYDTYKEQMSDSDKRLAKQCVCGKGHFIMRLKMAWNGDVYRLGRADNIVCKMLLVLGWL